MDPIEMTIEEFLKALPAYIMQFGYEDSFKTNPAFMSSIGNIRNEIKKLDLLDSTVIKIESLDKSLRFKFEDESSKGEVIISSLNNTEVSCVINSEIDYGLSIELGRNARRKKVIEITVNQDKNEHLNLTRNTCVISDVNLGTKLLDTLVTKETREYTPEGVMITRDEKVYNNIDFNKPFDLIKFDHMLLKTDIKDNGINSNSLTKHIRYDRETIDTARIFYINHDEDIRLSTVIELDTEKPRVIKPKFPLEVLVNRSPFIIDPITETEIDMLVNHEPNEKVREGLKEFAKKRINYSYNSEDDNLFEIQNNGLGIAARRY